MRGLLTLLLLGPGLVGPAAAQPGAPPPTVAEAQADGFQLRPPDQGAGSLLAGGLALGPGLVLHGLGHYYAGDHATAKVLFAAELVSVGLLTGALLANNLGDGRGELGGLSRGLTHAGVVLFAGSWGADVLGAFKGSTALELDSSRVRGNRFGLAYRYTDDPVTDFRHHLVFRLDLNAGWFFLRPLVDLEGSARLRQLQAEIGARPLRGDDPHERLELGVRLRRVENQSHGFSTVGLMGYSGYKVDLGRLVEGLRHLYAFGRVGYGWDGYQFAATPDSVPALFSDTALGDTYLLLETGLGFNLGQRTHLTLSALSDPTKDVPPFAGGTGGLVELGLVHRQSDSLDIEFLGTMGDGFALLLGLGYGL
ncbi:MAG: hypothetical protein KC613_18920 [Myxococcales bacterium]|nr:hypothetical protein [Myxococcales bacterium]MCB9523007.1 hypothetical protein [Myxococcales bacterium]